MNTRNKTKALAMSSHSIARHTPVEPSTSIHEPVESRIGAGDDASSMRSAQTNSSVSSTTLKARKAAAEAAYKRRQFENMKAQQAMQQQQQAMLQQQQAMLQQQLAEVEEAEYRAEIEQIEAEVEGKSRRSTTSQKRTQEWVRSISAIQVNEGNKPKEVSQPAHLSMNPQAAAPLLAAHLDNQAGFVPQVPGLAATVLPPSYMGLEEQRHNIPVCNNEFSPLLLQAVADTAAAAKSLAVAQNKTQKTKIELFAFTGNASQWLQFKKLFDTTKLSYTPAENVARLQSALRGAARESVASLLISAEDPEEIMRALERSFACPEMIVFGEVQVLKQLPRLGNDLKEIGTIANRVRNSLSTIKLLNHRDYLHSPELFHIILGKLNPMMKMRWSDYASEVSNPLLSKLEVLSEFLTREHERYIKFALSPDLSLSQATHQSHVIQSVNKPLKRENIHSVSHNKTKSNDKTECVYCKKKHNVKNCDEIKSLSVDERWRWIRENKICYKCLRRVSHQWKSCKVNPCGLDGCSFRHHPLLHGRQDTLTSSPASEKQSFNNTVCAAASLSDVPCTSPSSAAPLALQPMEEKVTVSNTGIHEHFKMSSQTNTFLKMVPVIVSGPAGDYETYALLDDGSTATLIDSNVAARIGLSGPQELITVNGVGGLQKSTNISYVNFYIQGKHENNKYLVSGARAMQALNLSTQTLSNQMVESYNHLKDLAHFLIYSDAAPTVLIGAEHWHLSITHEVRTGRRNEPVACRTLLGWTLYGVASSKTKPVVFINHCQLDQAELSEYERLELLIKEQYKLDSLGISKRETLHSKQDLRAIEILDATTTRLPTGRYEVGLPWRDDIHSIPDSYPQTLSRFLSLERRMLREPEFAGLYKQFIDNMLAKGYAEECDPTTYYRNFTGQENLNNIILLNSGCSKQTAPFSTTNRPGAVSSSDSSTRIRWYLPHFGVYHPQKRKLRVVHDAAATNQGVSLNSLLLQGPDLLENLLGILFRFREGRVAMSADIKEMFPQIRIREQERDALRFLWRDVQYKNTKPIKEYRMTAVIFGASSSPFTALYIKNKNARSHQDLYPEAANASIYSCYMDDYLDSVDDVTKAAQLSSDIVTIHRNACFEMRGWISNNQEALRLIPKEFHAAQPTEVNLGNNSTIINKVLGVSWDPLSDTIGFRTGLEGCRFQGSLNKRKALSHLMKIYDPLGLLGPIVVKGRILLQEVWRKNIDWDTPFPPSEVMRWSEWLEELVEVSFFSIPRWYNNENGEPLYRELHVFADASELAYACVAFWRFTYANGIVKLALIASKARVSPLKPTSIPRLELQAALIASRLAVTIKDCHKKKPMRTYLWTDSRTVLGWLRSDARTFKPFVAHRVGEITENSCVQDWRWVPTDLNVADDATRIKPLHLNPSHRWFSGPSFLLEAPEDWPIQPAGQPVAQEECKRSPALLVAHLVASVDFSRFSDWLRLLRATARVLQAAAKFRSFLDRTRLTVPNTDVRDRHCASLPASTTLLLPLSAELMEAAERHILQRLQAEAFAEEIQCIDRDETIPKSSRLSKLSPMMGEDGLLRLVGRIRAVENVSSDVKRPILLDGRHHVVRLLVQYFHRRAGHANNEMVINELRQKYWILRIRSIVRSVASQCLFCRIRKTKPMNPKTGDLPAQRLAHHRRPFTFTGLDYFGPISTAIGRRREKRYVALFTCMTSRAIHLELVHSLSADSAIMTLRRFVARRGTPDTIYSDNGTCFVGANRILRDFYQPEVENFAANRGIKWKFIPPAAPFFGGCWERLVRSVKVALNATLEEKAPKEEVLITLLLEAEAIINSRPLSHVSVCHEDQETLTPFHFLLGMSSNQVLPSTLDDRDLLRRADWRKALRLADHFWHRWVREILPTMQPRQVGDSREPALKIGDIVFIVDENMPRGTWPRGRVSGTFPGKDGVIRVVDVATSGGILRRPVKKVVKITT